ncbi:hypothetical protein [Streptomyces chartreusis]|uniref:hypothetical protein n=1 Tax=Streptomyces chartreusis TaxID=1969 RepID=UPI00380F7A61
MAALAKATVRCPGCNELLELSLRLDENAKPGPGELLMVVDRSVVQQHLAQAHPEAAEV